LKDIYNRPIKVASHVCFRSLDKELLIYLRKRYTLDGTWPRDSLTLSKGLPSSKPTAVKVVEICMGAIMNPFASICRKIIIVKMGQQSRVTFLNIAEAVVPGITFSRFRFQSEDIGPVVLQ